MSPKELCTYLERRSNGTNLTEQFHSEKESLLSWGKRNDILYTAKTFSEQKIGEEQYLGGGNEHDVYYDDFVERVSKVTKLPNSTELNQSADHWNWGALGSPKAYLTNLENHNFYFGDDILIEGILQVGDHVAIISSQPFIRGRKATDAEIEQWFISLNYTKGTRSQTFIQSFNNKEIMVFGARPNNVILTPTSEIVTIDLQIIVRQIKK